jgi:MarR family transcriptional regulator, transcriptional regulator for hemolysin
LGGVEAPVGTTVTAEVRPREDRRELLNALQEAQHAAVLRVIPEVARHGLEKSSFWSLYWLTQGTHPHPTELARRLGITGPACTAVVDQLVASGYVQRHPSAEDRRQVVLDVTPKGRRVAQEIWERIATMMDEASRDIPARDLATASRVLRTVAERLYADGEAR